MQNNNSVNQIGSKKRSNAVTCISRAIAVLDSLNLGKSKINEIAENVGLSNSTVHRLLQALVETKLAIEDSPNHKYYLGPNLIRLASNPMVNYQYLINRATKPMELLRDISRETISLEVKVAMERIKLNILMASENVAFISKPHTTEPIWSGASGKVLLSQLEEDELDNIIENMKFRAMTPRTIADKRKFKEEIQKVKSQGFATSMAEYVAGIVSTSVPVKYSVSPISLSMVGPEFRMADRMLDFLDDLKKAASEIEKGLLLINSQRKTKSS